MAELEFDESISRLAVVQFTQRHYRSAVILIKVLAWPLLAVKEN